MFPQKMDNTTKIFSAKYFLMMMKHRYQSNSLTSFGHEFSTIGNQSDAWKDEIVSGSENLYNSFDLTTEPINNEVFEEILRDEDRTSTKRQNMDEDLRKVWGIIDEMYKQQVEREKKYLENVNVHHQISFDEVFDLERTLNASPEKEDKVISWNNGDTSSNAIRDPWKMKHSYDTDGFKIYSDIEFETSLPKKGNGSFPSIDNEYFENDYDEVSHLDSAVLNTDSILTKKTSWKRSISSLFSKKKKLRIN